MEAHVASHDVYLAGLDTMFRGADFSTSIGGVLRLNAAPILARDITVVGHTDLEAAQVVRNICTYEARRIELRLAEVSPAPFSSPDDDLTRGMTSDDYEKLGISSTDSWTESRKRIADMLFRDLGEYRESLADKPHTADARQNVDAWLGFVEQVAGEFEQEIFVTSGPRLLPGVEVIAIDHASGGHVPKPQ